MSAQTDTATTPTPKGAPLAQLRSAFAKIKSYPEQRSNRNRRKPRAVSNIKIPTRNSFHHSQSFTLTSHPRTLVDGHAVPSIFAVTPAASTKAGKLMDTLSDSFERCYVLLRNDSAPPLHHRSVFAGHSKVIVFLVDTPVGIEKGFSPSESTTSPKLSRYTFDMVPERKNRTKKEPYRH